MGIKINTAEIIQYFDRQSTWLKYGLAVLVVLTVSIIVLNIPGIDALSGCLLLLLVVIQSAFWLGTSTGIIAAISAWSAFDIFILRRGPPPAAAYQLIVTLCFCLSTAALVKLGERHRNLAKNLHKNRLGIIESPVEAIIKIDTKQRILAFNKNAEKMFGCTSHAAKGFYLEHFIQPPAPIDFTKYLSQTDIQPLENNGSRDFGEVNGFSANGEILTCKMRIAKQRGKGGCDFIIILSECMSNRTADSVSIAHHEQIAGDFGAGLICAFQMQADGHLENLEYTNPVIEDIYALNQKNSIQTFSQMLQLLHPYDMDFLQKSLEIAIRSRQFWRQHFLCNHPFNTEVWLEGYATPLTDSFGKLLWHGYIYDITHSKKSESKIRSLENELRLITESTPALTAYLDTGLRYVKVYGHYRDWFAIEPELIPGMTVREVIGKKAWLLLRPYLQKALAGERVKFNLLVPYGVGKPRWINGSYTPDKNAAGEVIGILVRIIDIDERRLTSENLANIPIENIFLAEMTRISNQPLAMGYLDGRIGYVNKAFQELVGYTEGELLELNWINLTAPEWREFEKNKIEELIKDGVPVRYEKVYIKKNGQRLPVELLVHVISNPELTQQFLYAFVTDISERKLAEQKLAKSQKENQFLALLVRASSQPLVVMSKDFELEFVNTAFEKLVGYSLAELKQFGRNALTSPEWREIEAGKFAELESTGNPVIYEKEYISKNGDRVPVEVRAHIAQNAENRKDFYYGYITDIRERKTTANKLADSNLFLQNLLDSIPALIAVLDKDGVIRSTNKSWVDHAIKRGGKPEDVAVGVSFLEVCRKSVLRGNHSAQKPLQAIEAIIAGQKQEFVMDIESNGLWMLMQAKTINHQSNRIILSYTDITEVKKTEAKLRSMETKLSLVMAEVNAGYWDWNLSTGALYLSPEWKRQIGFEPDEPLNKKECRSRIHPEDRDFVLRSIKDYISGRNAVYELEFRLLHKDGSYRWIHSRGALLNDQNDDPCRLLGIHLDISDYIKSKERNEISKRIEESFRLSLAGQTVAVIAHELNQPLNAVIAYADVAQKLLEKGNSEPDTLKLVLLNCSQQALRASQVIRQLLQQLHKSNDSIELVDVNQTIKETIEIFHMSKEFSKFKLKTELADNLPQVRANSLQLQKVLINLIQNGLESMRENAMKAESLILSTHYYTDDPHSITVIVTDSGKGVADPQLLKSIFEHFYSTKSHGLGMGLTISRELIRSFGGKMWAVQNPDQGLSIHFTLPVEL